METVRFYTNKNKYITWEKVKAGVNYLAWCDWVESGNWLKIGDHTFKNKKELNFFLITKT